MLSTPTLDDAAVGLAPTPVRLGFDRSDPKFRPPKARRDSVRREDLLARLEQERCRPLILLTAPAGYGKTTLLAQWAAESSRPCAWVTLDHADDDPETLAASISGALETVGIDPESSTQLCPGPRRCPRRRARIVERRGAPDTRLAPRAIAAGGGLALRAGAAAWPYARPATPARARQRRSLDVGDRGGVAAGAGRAGSRAHADADPRAAQRGMAGRARTGDDLLDAPA